MKIGDETDARRLLALPDEALVRECEVDLYRASGPGGQKRNKTCSAVRLRHGPTRLSATACEDRSQHVNRRRALRRLRQAIAFDVRASFDLAGYEPSDAVSGCITVSGQIRISQRNDGYFAVVNELLNVAVACGMRMRDAAKVLGVSTSQLTEFLRRDTALWGRVGHLRRERGLKPLR